MTDEHNAGGAGVGGDEDGVRVAKKISKVRELFHGRFTEAEILVCLEHEDYDMAATATMLMMATPEDLQALFQENDKNGWQEVHRRVRRVKSDSQISREVQQGRFPTETRQFACLACDRSWWRLVPGRKQVSKCYSCRLRFDPVPTDREWGWGTFNCHVCSSQFGAWAMMHPDPTHRTKAVCYNCKTDGRHTLVTVSAISPPQKRPWGRVTVGDINSPQEPRGRVTVGAINPPQEPRGRVTASAINPPQEPRGRVTVGAINPPWGRGPRRHQHSCIGCGTDRCVYPQNRKNLGLPLVVFPSNIHISSGSTVDTFMTQTDLNAVSYEVFVLHSPPPTISEESEEDED